MFLQERQRLADSKQTMRDNGRRHQRFKAVHDCLPAQYEVADKLCTSTSDGTRDSAFPSSSTDVDTQKTKKSTSATLAVHYHH
jgi:hypothetical protein